MKFEIWMFLDASTALLEILQLELFPLLDPIEHQWLGLYLLVLVCQHVLGFQGVAADVK